MAETDYHKQAVKHWARSEEGQHVLFELGAAIYYASQRVTGDADGLHFSAIPHVKQVWFETLAKDVIAEAFEFSGAELPTFQPAARVLHIVARP